MSGFKKVYHKGKEIIYVDYRGLSEEEMMDTANDLRDFLLSEQNYHRRLVNISDAYATPKFTAFIRTLGKETKNVPVRAAIVGITGAKRVLLSGYNRILGGSMRPFNDEEDARDYLVAD